MNTLENLKLFSSADVNINFIHSITKEEMHRTWQYSRKYEKKLYMLIYVLYGEFMAHVNGTHFHLKEGDILYICSHREYASNSISNDFACICIYFDIKESPSMEDSFFRESHLIHNCEKLKKKFTGILNEYNIKSYKYKLTTKKILYDILDTILNETMITSDSQIDFYALKNAIIYLENNYTRDDISIDYLANLCNYTPAHFINLFKKIYNTTPKNYLINLRIEKAKDLLIYSSYSVLEISELIGYSSPAYFSAAFKSIEGCSPLQYRKKNN